MDTKVADQILDELGPTFEAIEAQSAALIQFLKEKGIATDEQLAPYLERAAAASSVRWRALRVRMGRLFSMAEKTEDEKRAKEKGQEKAANESQPGVHDDGANKEAHSSEASNKTPGPQQGNEQGSQERRDPGNQNTKEASVAKSPAAPTSSDVKEPAQKEPTVPGRSEEARPRKDEGPGTNEKKDAA